MKKFAVLSLAFVLVLLGSRDSAAGVPQSLEDWCVNRMASWSPPGKSAYPEAKETEDEGLARYRSIAGDAISVVYDPSEAPLFPGPYGRAKTLAMMLGIADSESGFRKDVDLGKGSAAKGDGGRSWCLMQVQLGQAVNGKTPMRIATKGDTFEYVYDKKSGWGGEDLVSDRKACFRAALHIMRTSFNACSGLPVEEKLSVYTSGNCTDGRVSSKIRVGKAIRWLAATAPPLNDVDAIASMAPPAPPSTVAANP